MSTPKLWEAAFERSIPADVARIWETLSNVETWKEWNPGVLNIEIDGPFAAGSSLRMTLPDGLILHSKLAPVEAPRVFTDETWVDGTVVRVAHKVDALGSGQSRVTFHIQAEGAAADDIGPMASSDFPDVLAGLARFLG